MHPQCPHPYIYPFPFQCCPLQMFHWQSMMLGACAKEQVSSPTAPHLRPRFLRLFFALGARPPLSASALPNPKAHVSRVALLALQTTCCVSGDNINNSPSLRRLGTSKARVEKVLRTRMAA